MSNTTLRLTAARPASYRPLLIRRRAWYDGSTDEGTPPDKGGNGGGQNGEAKFTQADLDRIAGDTRKSAKQAAINDLLKELGFEKADDLKALVADAKKRKDDELSEAQKAQAAKEKAEKDALDWKAKAEALEQQRLLDRRDGAIESALREAKASKPDKVLALLKQYQADDVAAVLGDTGEVDKTRLSALLTTAKKEHAEYFQQGVGSGSHAGGKGGSTVDVEKILGKRPFGSL